MRSTILHPTLLDPKTRRPLAAIGTFRGRPIWPVLGAADDPPADPPADKPIQTTQAEIDRIVEDRLNRERATKYADYNDLKAKAEKFDQAQADAATELDKAKAAAKEEGKSEATAAVNQRVVKAEAKVQAGEMSFHNPARAAALLDLSKVKVGDDGEPDSAAVKALLKALAESDPYLVKSDDGKPRRPRPNNGQGPREGQEPTGRDAGKAEAARRFKKP